MLSDAVTRYEKCDTQIKCVNAEKNLRYFNKPLFKLKSAWEKDFWGGK